MLVKGEPRKDKEMIRYTLSCILNIFVKFNPRWPFEVIQGLDWVDYFYIENLVNQT